MRRHISCLAGAGLLAVSWLGGCAPQEPAAAPQATSTDLTKMPEPPPPPVLKRAELPYPRGGRVEMAPQGDGSQVTVREEPARTKAQVGVGVQGRRLDDEGLVQMIVTPARALFRTRERVVFDIQIPQAMNLFAATNGRKPNSQEEFSQQILEANNIKLPELPAGQRYVYDPEAGELMVEQPAK